MFVTLIPQTNKPHRSQLTLLFQIPFYCLKKDFNLREVVETCKIDCQTYKIDFTEIKITPVLGRNIAPNQTVTKKRHPLMYLVLITLEGIREDLDTFYELWRADSLKHSTKYFNVNPSNFVDKHYQAAAAQNKTPLALQKVLETHNFQYNPILLCEVIHPNEVKVVQAYFKKHSMAWQLSFPSLPRDVIRVFDFDFLLDKALFQIAHPKFQYPNIFPLKEKDLIPFFDESIAILFPNRSEWGLNCRIDRKPYP